MGLFRRGRRSGKYFLDERTGSHIYTVAHAWVNKFGDVTNSTNVQYEMWGELQDGLDHIERGLHERFQGDPHNRATLLGHLRDVISTIDQQCPLPPVGGPHTDLAGPFEEDGVAYLTRAQSLLDSVGLPQARSGPVALGEFVSKSIRGFDGSPGTVAFWFARDLYCVAIRQHPNLQLLKLDNASFEHQHGSYRFQEWHPLEDTSPEKLWRFYSHMEAVRAQCGAFDWLLRDVLATLSPLNMSTGLDFPLHASLISP